MAPSEEPDADQELTAVAAYSETADIADRSCSVPEEEAALIEGVLSQINDARADEDLQPLILNDVLSHAAGDYACEMLENDFFAHESPVTSTTPGDRLTAAGYLYYAMGENLAVGQPTANEVFHDWMQSPLHRANILAPEWREIGIAVRTGGTYGFYWVKEFADPIELSSTR